MLETYRPPVRADTPSRDLHTEDPSIPSQGKEEENWTSRTMGLPHRIQMVPLRRKTEAWGCLERTEQEEVNWLTASDASVSEGVNSQI